MKDNIANTSTHQYGFSLIEIMMALVLSSVVLIVGFQLITHGKQVNSRTESLISANSIAFAKIQEYENTKFDNIPTGKISESYEIEDFTSQMIADSSGDIIDGTAKVYAEHISDDKSNLIKLNVVIDFRYGANMRTIEYGTYIQKDGIGR